MQIFVHDYGEAKVGPAFTTAFNALTDDLKKSARTKAYKQAVARRAELEQCLATLAEVIYAHGGGLEITP